MDLLEMIGIQNLNSCCLAAGNDGETYGRQGEELWLKSQTREKQI
jgi:hypothetical protein